MRLAPIGYTLVSDELISGLILGALIVIFLFIVAVIYGVYLEEKVKKLKEENKVWRQILTVDAVSYRRIKTIADGLDADIAQRMLGR